MSRFYLERSTEEERLANSIPPGEDLAAGSRREVALVIRGEFFRLFGVGVLFPMSYFCIINQLHSWGSFITEPQQGQAVGAFIGKRGFRGKGEARGKGCKVNWQVFNFIG